MAFQLVLPQNAQQDKGIWLALGDTFATVIKVLVICKLLLLSLLVKSSTCRHKWWMHSQCRQQSAVSSQHKWLARPQAGQHPFPFPQRRLFWVQFMGTYTRYQRHGFYQGGLVELWLLLRVLHVDHVQEFQRIYSRIAANTGQQEMSIQIKYRIWRILLALAQLLLASNRANLLPAYVHPVYTLQLLQQLHNFVNIQQTYFNRNFSQFCSIWQSN